MNDVIAPATLTRDAEHRYWLGAQRLDGVTEVLTGVGICDLEYVNPDALLRGSLVHQAAHIMDTQALDFDAFIARFDLDEQLHGYARAWERCKRETKMQILDSEQMRYHKMLLFAGQRDKRVYWQGHHYIIDIKTVATPGAAGPKWAAEQTAAYALLEPAPDKMHPDRRASIILYPNGAWKPELHQEYSDEGHFLAYLRTVRRLKFHHGKIKERTNHVTND